MIQYPKSLQVFTEMNYLSSRDAVGAGYWLISGAEKELVKFHSQKKFGLILKMQRQKTGWFFLAK